jgi:hypothetical protein
MTIIDDLMKKESKPQILSGGPDKDGQWQVVVSYLAEGVEQEVILSIKELNEWCKRNGI